MSFSKRGNMIFWEKKGWGGDSVRVQKVGQAEKLIGNMGPWMDCG